MGHISGRYAIVGFGETKVGKRPEASTHSLHLEGIKACLDDAGIKASEVDGFITNRSTTRTVVTPCAWRIWRA
jgi:acetyl-CoA acetyltransferase